MDKVMEKLTNAGRVPAPVGFTKEKALAADALVKGLTEGDPMAEAMIKRHLGARHRETLTTGDDFIFSFTQILALEIDNNFEAAERTWDEVVDIQRVSTFDAPKVFAIDYHAVEGFARPQTEPGKPAWVPPVVPEGSPYPSFKFSGELAQAGAIVKAGGIFDLTFEKIVSDLGQIVPQLPGIITQFLLDREDFDAWWGLIEFINIPANHLQAGRTLAGAAVAEDAPLSPEALEVALEQAANREIDGRKVSVSSYRLLVPKGRRRGAEFVLTGRSLLGLEVGGQLGADTTAIYRFNGYNPLGDISGVSETEYLTGSQWAIVPAKGAVRGNKRFYSLGKLIGHEAPEVRVENVTGNYAGGGVVPPFEGSFRTDSAAMRGRIIGGGLGWNPEYAVFSDGDGVLPPSEEGTP